MIIREAEREDSKGVVDMFRVLDAETTFLLYEPGERDSSIEAQAASLERFSLSPRDAFFIALDEAAIRGFCAGQGGHVKRNRHCLHIIIGITQAFTGKGIGRRLMIEIENWATERDFRRLELTVMSHNARAIALYSSLGYLQEGTRKRSLRVEDQFIDEFTMVKLV